MLHQSMLTTLLALALLTRVDADVEVTHDFGLSPLRGTIALSMDLELLRSSGWWLEVFTTMRTYVRHNEPPESVMRISPHQVHYPVGMRLRFPLGYNLAWGLFVYHQSNHDIDTTDPILNRETLSYEIYGAEFVAPHFRVHGGLYADRGTRLSGKKQNLPFDYYLGGLTVEADHTFATRWYTAGELTIVGHLNDDHSPAHFNLSGHVDAGHQWRGEGGDLRVFLRGQRVEDYQYLGDPALHMLLLGVGMGNFQ